MAKAFYKLILLLVVTRFLSAETPSTFSLSGGYSYLNQTEGHGHLGSLAASYQFKPDNQVYLGALFEYREGPLSGSDRWEAILDLGALERIGYTFSADSSCQSITGYTGIGYRYIHHQARWFHIPFSFSSNSFYVPLGLMIKKEIGPRFSIGVLLEWRPQVYSFCEVFSPVLVEATREFDSCYLEIPLSYRVLSSPKLEVSFVPFVDFWQEGKSVRLSDLSMPCPSQNFLFVGANLSLDFFF